MELVLLLIELKKLAARGLRLAASIILPLAILNLSLGATILLSTPPGFEKPGITGSDQEIKLVHMQMFGGVIHLHDGSGPDHSHSPNVVLPAGVTEQEYLPVPTRVQTQTQSFSDWTTAVTGNPYMAFNGSDSAANYWQDLTTRGQATPSNPDQL